MHLTHMIRILATVLFIVSASSPAATGKLKADVVIQNIGVIDVKTGNIMQSADVIIIKDKIHSISKARKSSAYDAKQLIDGTGKFLIPGLWDMHTHTWNNYEKFFPMQLANGVTGIREMWGNLDAVKKIKQGLADGSIEGPMIISAGAIIDGKPPTWGSSDIAETPEQGREFVRKQKQAGADFIKVYFNLKRDVFLAIADEAAKQNLPVVGHLPNRVPMDEAVKAGFRSFEHLWNILEFYGDQTGLAQIEETREGRFAGDKFYDRFDYGLKTFDSTRTQDAIAILKNDNVWICPTFTVHKGFQRDYDPTYTTDPRLAFMPENFVNSWMANKKNPLTEKQLQHWNSDKLWYDRVIKETKKYKAAGVKFIAGTDSPNFFVYPGFSIHEELEIFVNEAGFTPLEALQTATLNAAQFLQLDDQLGTIEAGKLANLVILDKNPLEQISNSKTIHAVVIRGKYKAAKTDLMDITIR